MLNEDRDIVAQYVMRSTLRLQPHGRVKRKLVVVV
jgi:hypothetical protein